MKEIKDIKETCINRRDGDMVNTNNHISEELDKNLDEMEF